MVEYIKTREGRDAVVVPLEDWEEMQVKLEKQEILEGIREGLREALELEKSGAKERPWEEIMKELNEGTDD